MITVCGLILDVSMIEVLECLKADMNSCGVELLGAIKNTEKDIMISCPYHKDGKESRPSCGVHKETGIVHCFTCGMSTTLPDMIGHCFGKPEEEQYMFGMKWLRDNFASIEEDNRPDIDIDFSRNNLKKTNYSYVPEIVLDQYRYTHPYMYKRKLTDSIIDMFDIGYDRETNCVTFPVRDIYGNCLFVARRAVDKKWFNYPSGAHKPLYGAYELKNNCDSNATVVVCESMFNCLTCWTHGIPAVALNGTGSYEQIQELKKLPFRALIIALDPDEAGRKGTEKIKKYVKNKLIYTVDYKDGRDINDLETEEVEELFMTTHLM